MTQLVVLCDARSTKGLQNVDWYGHYRACVNSTYIIIYIKQLTMYQIQYRGLHIYFENSFFFKSCGQPLIYDYDQHLP